ncbi:hypothetical protein DFH11DRAFT_1727670 [Phellopilus nigrolimitatus]|nr:hypothetical protein DFH11DRAFT_1727670 [Phellopilus nigrolimitatus]
MLPTPSPTRPQFFQSEQSPKEKRTNRLFLRILCLVFLFRSINQVHDMSHVLALAAIGTRRSPHRSTPPAQLLSQHNPPPDVTQVELNISVLTINRFCRAADYIARIFLKVTVLLERELTHDDIKPRLLGLGGPGLVLLYAYLDRIVIEHDSDAFYIVGPNPFFSYFSRDFAFSIDRAQHPEHREFSPVSGSKVLLLASTLSARYKASLSGFISKSSASRRLPKCLAWLEIHRPHREWRGPPIAYVTGFKIFERTIYGIMNGLELCVPFRCVACLSLLLAPVILTSGIANTASLKWAFKKIRIQSAVHKEHAITKPTYSALILRKLKGWASLESSNEEFIEGSFRAHWVPLPKVKYDPKELETPARCVNSAKPLGLRKEANVFVGIGVEPTLRWSRPWLYFARKNLRCACASCGFPGFFAAERAAHFNYHEYACDLRGLLFGQSGAARTQIVNSARGRSGERAVAANALTKIGELIHRARKASESFNVYDTPTFP